MILSFTGHRKISGHYYPHKSWHPICREVVRILEEEKPSLIISGGAIGFDQLACDAAISLNIPYMIASPFKNQDQTWPEKSREKYQRLLTTAIRVVIVSDGEYSADKMQRRNEYLIDHSNKVLALLDPTRPSGTANCISYAKQKNRPIIHIDPRLIK